MAQVQLRLFGLREGHSRLNKISQIINQSKTVGDLWNDLQGMAEPGDRLAAIDREGILALVNGRPIHLLQGWETMVVDQDQVTFMLKTAGG